MDLFKLLIGSGKPMKLCFLCFKNNKDNLNFDTLFEIRNNLDVNTLSLGDMLKYLFPNLDFVLLQACNDCLDLISELYMLMYNRKSKILVLDFMVQQLLIKTNAPCGIPIENNKVILNVEVPSNQELINGDLIHIENNENLSSDVLNFVYNQSTSLDRHSEVKSCQYCSETFCQTAELRSHLKIHRNKRQRRHIHHYCKECNYKTFSKTTLQAHINKNHLNTRPHICEVCYKGFYNKSNLNEHIKTHNKQRNQVCERCGCSFIHKKSLIEHLRLHSDTRPYICHICQKTFVTSGRRSDHIKRSHMEKTECCLICNKKYSLKKELTRHMNNVHLRDI